MDSQLEAVRHKIPKVEDKIEKIEQDLAAAKEDLAAAKEAKNGEQERKLFDMLLSLNNQLGGLNNQLGGLNNQLSGLQEEKNILLRSQAPSETGPESSRVLTAVLESLDNRLHTIELGVKLSTYQTKIRLRYSASKASNESRPDNKEFKLALIRAYQPQQELKTSLFCMVTGVELPKENIVGAHIASHSKRTDMECLLLIKNIDDVRNGMLWSQPIETAYEDSRICFAFHPADGEYRLHVLDSALLGLSLAEPFPHHSKPKAPLHANKFQAISWQDVDGKCIQFGTSCTRPFKRAFTLHAYLAWDLQIDRQCLPDSFDARGILTSQWSCDEVSGEVMQWLASTIPNALGTVAEVDNEVDLEEDDASGVSS